MKVFLAILLISVLGCQTPVPQQPQPDQDVHLVIGACILDVVGSADSAKYYYKAYPPLYADIPQDMKKDNDSICRLLDTAKVYLCINKTLGGIDTADQAYLNKILKDEQPADTLQTPAQLIDTTFLSGILGIRTRTVPELINDEIRLIGFFRFSKVILNTAKNKAWVALNFYRGKSGYCDYFFLDKKEGKWILTKRERTWIS